MLASGVKGGEADYNRRKARSQSVTAARRAKVRIVSSRLSRVSSTDLDTARVRGCRTITSIRVHRIHVVPWSTRRPAYPCGGELGPGAHRFYSSVRVCSCWLTSVPCPGLPVHHLLLHRESPLPSTGQCPTSGSQAQEGRRQD